MKQEKEKKVKKSFFLKLKEKVDKIFENENLTFIGKILMICIYVVPLSIIAITPIEVIEKFVNVCLFYAPNATYSISFSIIKGMIIALFVIALVTIFSISIVEAINCTVEEQSILTYDKEA